MTRLRERLRRSTIVMVLSAVLMMALPRPRRAAVAKPAVTPGSA